MLIFSNFHCPRFHYACEILLEDYPKAFEITDDKIRFSNHQGIKIEYNSFQEFSDALFVPQEVTLWNGDICLHNVGLGDWKGIPTLYPKEGIIPFDIFSAIFFLITRYEEYLPFNGDRMNRFSASCSISYKYEFLQQPVIDWWRKYFYEEIQLKWPSVIFKKREFSFLSTIDVDSAFAYKHKGVKRTLGGIAKDILNMNFRNLKYRVMTLMNIQRDKYITYSYIEEQCNKYGIENKYFFLLSDFAQYDRNVSYRSLQLQKLIRSLRHNHVVGIHPGVASNASIEKLRQEKKRLECILGEECSVARQHYLMLWFPKTYRELLEVGITEDYTMGYADDVGYRAGTSRPFLWFDLHQNKQTELKVFPFAIMDTTLKNYLKLNKEEAISISAEMIKEAQGVNGNFISLWHNESLSDSDDWKGWRVVWEKVLQEAKTVI